MGAEVDAFLGIFLEEARDVLETWERLVLGFSVDAPKDLVDALFRAAHNLKGSSRSVGLLSFGAFVHAVEDLMADIGQGKVAKSDDVRNLLIDSHGVLFNWVQNLEHDPSYEEDTSRFVEKISALRNADQNGASETAAFGLFDDPPVSPPSSHSPPPSVTKVESSGGNFRAEKGSISDQSEESIRISSRKIDGIFRELSELSIQVSAIEHLVEKHGIGQDVRDAVAKAMGLVRTAQEDILSLRMLPLTALFQRLERVTLDVGRNLNKKVLFQSKGSETKLDKFVIDQIKDPLIHILRNAMDHGIESSQDRLLQKKPEHGTITLEAEQKSGSVELRIKDDGRGLDEDRILRKALEKGLVSEVDKLTPAQIRALIFLPGFSTAEKVSDISGRGVGMDVVRTAIATLRGQIEIESVRHQGTTFVVTLPSTVSLFDVLIVESGMRQFAIPMVEIEEIIELKNVKRSSQNHLGTTIVHHGRVMPVVQLGARLHRRQDALADAEGDQIALLANSHQGQAAITIERIIGQKVVVTRPLLGPMKNLNFYSGMTVLGNGEPCLILNMREISKDIASDLQSGEVSRAV